MKTRQLKLVQTLTLATCVALTLAARADDYPPKAHHEELNAKLTGAHFVHKASMAGMKEIKLGKVAQDRAENAEVKTFASRLVMDHRQANDRLATLAKQKGISLPDDVAVRKSFNDTVSVVGGPGKENARGAQAVSDVPPVEPDKTTKAGRDNLKDKLDKSGHFNLEKFEHLNGAEFDQAFLKKMVADHHEAVALFTRASQELDDADLKAFASETLPKLQAHLREAQRLSGQLFPSNR